MLRPRSTRGVSCRGQVRKDLRRRVTFQNAHQHAMRRGPAVAFVFEVPRPNVAARKIGVDQRPWRAMGLAPVNVLESADGHGRRTPAVPVPLYGDEAPDMCVGSRNLGG